ncbi:MAG: YedE family putative selenium transporter [Anaerolineae bacterium]|nr:YedE family putative selenium transporter [Anaerolineae bacterium]MDW8067667.1 YedE family putative selenium transporter [Anaerolineae bacterium]
MSISERLTRFFASRWGILLVGAVIGLLAPLLQKAGNPPNMGICMACFERDIAGALGLHRAATVQYIRPEIIAFVLGALIAALVFREFKPRAGSAPLVRFFLGMFAMIGALAFLGCPWRALLRLAGGDLNGLVGIAGLVSGIAIGILFLKQGYSLGPSRPAPAPVGWIMPALMLVLLLFLLLRPQFAKDGPIFFSKEGPGSQHAPILISLAVGLVIGFLAQRTRFCTIGAWRDLLLMRHTHLLTGVGALFVVALFTNLALGQFKLGFTAQPVAHSNHLANFLGMALAGLAFLLAGGCPGRQLFLTGEGDSDAGLFVLGMIFGAGFAHNFALVGVPDTLTRGALTVGGPGPYGQAAILIGLVFCIALGSTMREQQKPS